jgi:hypothetical protein
VNSAERIARLRQTYVEQSENLRMLRRAAAELAQNAEYLGAWEAAPTDAARDVQDRFIFRFSKSVDVMRKRWFPQVLDYTDDLADWPTLRDRLHRLEKYGLLDAETWLELGQRRNAFEHDYPDEPRARGAALRQAHELLPEIETTWRRCHDWLVQRQGVPLPPCSAPDAFQPTPPASVNPDLNARGNP